MLRSSIRGDGARGCAAKTVPASDGWLPGGTSFGSAAALGSPFLNNTGDLDGAREYYRKAIAIAREIARADPQDRTGQWDLASALLRYAAVDVPRAGLAESLATIRQAAEILEKLSQGDPQALRYKRGLTMAHEYAGHRLRDLGRLEEAIAEYGRSLAILIPLEAAYPSDSPILAQTLSSEEAL